MHDNFYSKCSDIFFVAATLAFAVNKKTLRNRFFANLENATFDTSAPIFFKFQVRMSTYY